MLSDYPGICRGPGAAAMWTNVAGTLAKNSNIDLRQVNSLCEPKKKPTLLFPFRKKLVHIGVNGLMLKSLQEICAFFAFTPHLQFSPPHICMGYRQCSHLGPNFTSIIAMEM